MICNEIKPELDVFCLFFAGAWIPGPPSGGGARSGRLQGEQRPRLGGGTLRPQRFRNERSGHEHLREHIRCGCGWRRKRRVPELRRAADASARPRITFIQPIASAPVADAVGADEHRLFRLGFLLPHPPLLLRFGHFRQAASASSAQEERHHSPLDSHPLTHDSFRPEFRLSVNTLPAGIPGISSPPPWLGTFFFLSLHDCSPSPSPLAPPTSCCLPQGSNLCLTFPRDSRHIHS